MAWAFQGVANACIQILSIILTGYCLKWRKLISDHFLQQVNSFQILVAIPCLMVVYMGIQLDLRDAEGWKAMAAYLLWIGMTQVIISIYVAVFAKRDLGEAAVLNLLLTANNTFIIGLPIMNATFGSTGRFIALLTAIPLFLQVMPFSIILFEVELARKAAVADNIDEGKGSTDDKYKGIEQANPSFQVFENRVSNTPSPTNSNKYKAGANTAYGVQVEGSAHSKGLTMDEHATEAQTHSPIQLSTVGGQTQEREQTVIRSDDLITDMPDQAGKQRDSDNATVQITLDIDSPRVHAEKLQQCTSFASSRAQPPGGSFRNWRSPSMSKAIAYLEGKRSRWKEKKRLRSMVSAVDVPLPVHYELHLGKTPCMHSSRLKRIWSGSSKGQQGNCSAKKGLFDFQPKNKGWQVFINIVQNPMLLSTAAAIIVSVSGLRVYLDPSSVHYVIGMGWLVQAMTMLGNTAVPLSLFSNGVFLYGKRFWEGNIKKAIVIALLKIVVFPPLQLLCCKLLKLSTNTAMSLVLLACCPPASTSFVLATQYKKGAEIVTMVTVSMTAMLVPIMLAGLKVPQALHLYSFDSAAFPLP